MIIMGFTFNKDSAMKAGTNEYITESGVYVGKFVKALETIHDSGAVSISFDFVSKDDQKASYLRIVTRKKDGSDAFGANQICALMGLLRLQNAEPISLNNGVHANYTCFCNKQIAIALQREEKDNGRFGMNILHFFDPVSLKTFSEHVNNEEAKTHKKVIKDRINRQTPVDTSFNFGANIKGIDTSSAHDDVMFGPSDTLPWENKK